ncbi:Protein kinase domain/Protein tyrosine kinase, putative [Angomonas deanei]|uniref:non-specific serine/threonine protein kinase n=1 Tax=Angomonas deanei TaxID=59799 RepID=A0A7G2CF78_9TRYP|nr:Protein kinase domain/Protein tyrosine kinase, putative [Angomonas deanei]
MQKERAAHGEIEIDNFISLTPQPHCKYYYQCYLSRGATGSTWQIKRYRDDAIFALKINDLSKLKSDEARMRTEMEVKCLEAIDHFACVGMHDTYRTERWLFIVLEYCDAGDLEYQLKNLPGRLLQGEVVVTGMEEYRISFILLQLLLGLHYMHTCRKILHRDLKPANVLLSTNGIVKIGDFGLSNKYDTITGDVGSTICGTPPYTAPELWEQKRYGVAADMWSLGVLLYQCMTGRPPFYGAQLESLRRSILMDAPPPITGDYSEGLQQIVFSLLCKRSRERPTSEELLHLPYVQGVLEKFPTVLKASKVPEEVLRKMMKDIENQLGLVVKYHIDPTITFQGVVEKFKHPDTFVSRHLTLANGYLHIGKVRPSELSYQLPPATSHYTTTNNSSNSSNTVNHLHPHHADQFPRHSSMSSVGLTSPGCFSVTESEQQITSLGSTHHSRASSVTSNSVCPPPVVLNNNNNHINPQNNNNVVVNEPVNDTEEHHNVGEKGKKKKIMAPLPLRF